MLHLRPYHLLALVIASISVLAIALLAGCQAVPPTTPLSTLPAQSPDALARTLRAQGKLVEAANEYLRLSATVESPESDSYRLEAVAVLAEANELTRARALLRQPLSPLASRDLRQHQDLLRATIALAEQRPEAVLSILPEDFALEASPQRGAEAHRLRAQAHLQLRHYIAATDEHVRLELTLLDPEAIRANRLDLWHTLARLDAQALSQYAGAPPATLDGWVELAALSRDALIDPAAFLTAIDAWRARYPRHPASEEIVPELIALSHGQTAHPRQLALLLPFEGPFANAAAAIRDGFVAAWFDDPSALRPTLIIRGTASANIPMLYREVVAEGADYVVGPLDKPAVTALSHLPNLLVPTLALNYIPHPVPKPPSRESGLPRNAPGTTPRLYQFSLSPEAEARAVAKRAWDNDHHNAAVLFPEGSWGKRVKEAFSDAWSQLGGQVTAAQVYPNDVHKMSAAVRQLLDIDESKQRYRLLKATLKRRLKHTPRRRRDIDFIFMAAFPEDARQLRPLLRFYHAAEVPVYATSHVFSGVHDPRADADIDGVLFADMPWVLVEEGQVAELRHQLQALWSAPLAQYGRLYAFGFDAYHLIPYLKQLESQPFVEVPGLSGRLVMNGDHRIQRRLLWAEFKNGVPKLRSTRDAASTP
jgi:outer membrane PBP1 activator LpoA protein